ncbi:MAG: hypothetical protein ACI4S3_08775 [Candidatus Gastranaerophilaceae bacterium]
MTLNISSTPYSNYSSQIPVNNKKVPFKGNLEKEKSSKTKKVVGGLAIATTIALAIYAIKTGKLGKLKNVTGGTKPVANGIQNEVTNIKPNAIDDVVKTYSERAKSYITAEGEPIITQLKNGKQKIEFLGQQKPKRAIIICDNGGKVKRLIEFYGKSYNVFDGLNPFKAKFLTSCEYKRTRANEYVLHIEKPFDFKRPDDRNMAEISKLGDTSHLRWRKDITIRSNEKVANIHHSGWYIPNHHAPNQSICYDIYNNGKKPADIIKNIEATSGGKINHLNIKQEKLLLLKKYHLILKNKV